MRLSSLAVLLLPALAACRICHSEPQPAHSPSTATIPSATAAASIPVSSSAAPEPTSNPAIQENLDLRAREIVVNPAAPQPPSVPAAVPGVKSTARPGEPQVSVTVQWVETMLKGGIKTWVPVTVAVTFVAVPSQAPQPGEGVIGMGTLTGQTGITKTVQEGAAPTMGAGWMRIGAAVGVGIAGLVV
ncbi:hypothetical protein BCR34DRAFT_582260 [Clohesyomyces aquaticus]|uniref:Uncharacterized protein n=1 Tax=Clohesyomyces aquaticus TaxID=1231657 RepID=A0A1Y2AAN4_9PLEO|nr:hypothetical protein BCR34DRAFT_582260 [Clohesyomyces aquaticus]